jgi:hypothetical protein
MSQPSDPNLLLAYQTPGVYRPSPMRTAAWISLLVLGILYGAGGLCIGAGTIIANITLGRAVAAGPPGPAAMASNIHWIMIAMGLAFLAVTWAVAATYIWTALLVRRGSRAAAVTALVIAVLNALVILGFVVLGVIGMLMEPGRPDPEAALGLVVFLLPAVANIWVVIALSMVLRERRV